MEQLQDAGRPSHSCTGASHEDHADDSVKDFLVLMMIVTLRRRKRVLANRTKTMLLLVIKATALTLTFFFLRSRPPAGFLSPHCYPLRQDRCWPPHITCSFELKWSHLVSNIQDSGQWLRVGGHLRGKCWFYISFDLIFAPQQKSQAAPISLMILALFC